VTTRAQDKRFWLAGGAALAVLILAIGWFGLISPQRSSTSSLRAEADSAQAQNTVLAAKVAKLKQQNDGVGELKTELRTALGALPFDTGLPTFTRQVAGQATRSKVALTSISVGTAATTAGAPAATTGTGTTGTGTTGTGTTGTGTTGTAGTGASGAGTAATGSGTVMAIPITLLSTGTSAHQLAFLKAVQVQGPRRALVSSTNLGGGSAGGGSAVGKSTTMTIQMTIFTAPLDAAGRKQLLKLLSAK
jgi:hypothetical protein